MSNGKNVTNGGGNDTNPLRSFPVADARGRGRGGRVGACRVRRRKAGGDSGRPPGSGHRRAAGSRAPLYRSPVSEDDLLRVVHHDHTRAPLAKDRALRDASDRHDLPRSDHHPFIHRPARPTPGGARLDRREGE